MARVDMIRNLANDRGELACRHVGSGSVVLIDIPELDENLGPSLRISTAIHRRELSGLDLGDMIAGPDGLAIIGEYERGIRCYRQDIEEMAEGDVGRTVSSSWRTAVADIPSSAKVSSSPKAAARPMLPGARGTSLRNPNVPVGIIAALGLTQIVGYGTLYYSFSILAPRMAADLAITVTHVFAIFSASLFVGGLSAP